MAGPIIKDYLDRNWVRQSFMVNSEDLDQKDQENSSLSTAAFKFTDTTPGGNIAINPLPQFCRYTDPRVPSRYSASMGMGDYYSTAFDDNAQIVHFRMGVPAFNSLTSFFTGFYNSTAASIARTGRAPSVFYTLGRAAGFVVTLGFFPYIMLGQITSAAWNFFFDKPSSKFYYSKPSMPTYWNAVQTMVNHLAVNIGVIPKVWGNDIKAAASDGYEFGAAGNEKMHALLPDIFRKNGGIDVYALANRAQRLANKDYQASQARGNVTNTDLREMYRNVLTEQLDDTPPAFEDYLNRWINSPAAQPVTPSGQSATEQKSTDPSLWQRLKEFAQAEIDDGSAFVSFRVDATGSVSETFSTSVTESEISSKLNSVSAQSRSSSFNFANGNVVGGAAGALLGGAINAVKDFGSGLLDQVELSGLAALGGAAFVDVPKRWESSTVSLPATTYTIKLGGPYGNPLSRLLNIYVPLSMLLAMALPLSTGKQSWTSPYLIEYYDRARCQSRLAMISSMTVTRGGGNLGFDNDGALLACEVSLSLVDLSSVLHMPIAEGFSLDPTAGIFDEDTIFTDYMATLSGMSLADQIYPSRKLKYNLTRSAANFDSMTSVSRFTSFMGDTAPARLVKVIYRGIEQ